MTTLGWYAREGHLDLFPHIARRLESLRPDVVSEFICSTDLDKDELVSHNDVASCFVLDKRVRERMQKIKLTNARLRELEAEYPYVPLARVLWSTRFECKFSETFAAKLLIALIEEWTHFIRSRKVDVMFSELPSIPHTCAAWLVCKKLGVPFHSPINMPIDRRRTFTSTWKSDFGEFDRKLESIKVDRRSADYRAAVDYLNRMVRNPRKTADAEDEIQVARTRRLRRIPLDAEKLIHARRYWTRYRKRRQSLLYPSILAQWRDGIAFHLSSVYYARSRIFESDLPDEPFFLLPLHMRGEWSDYNWMGLAYANQINVVRQAAACLPLGYRLYVKEHTANFGEKPPSFYRAIRRIPEVRLVDPFVDTFSLIRRCKGVLTLGSTVGFEAFLYRKPVFTLGSPWYRNCTGIYKVRNDVHLCELLQYADAAELADEEEQLRVIYTLINMSFPGYRFPHPETLSSQNIDNFAAACSTLLEPVSGAGQ